jgi:hypothetical protein
MIESMIKSNRGATVRQDDLCSATQHSFWTTGTGPYKPGEDAWRANEKAGRCLTPFLMNGTAPIFPDVTGKSQVINWVTYHVLDVIGPKPPVEDWVMHLNRHLAPYKRSFDKRSRTLEKAEKKADKLQRRR